jgi:hypothetical protein
MRHGFLRWSASQRLLCTPPVRCRNRRESRQTNLGLYRQTLRPGPRSPVYFEHNRRVFQLQYKPFYEAVGDANSRSRREHQPQTIKARLMALDFVQAHAGDCFLTNEQQKVSLLTSRGVPVEILPAKAYGSPDRAVCVRRFVDRFPMFVKPTENASASRLAFTCIDSGFETSSAFVTYLRHYTLLFRAIGEFGLIYVGTHRSR